jgi:cell division protease FtsH
VRMADFDSALERVVAGMQSSRALSDHEKRVVAYHEAGHALCGELLPSVDRVHRISIVPRGNALGYTLNLPDEDRYLKTREELIDFMTMLLGGRAAEQLVFGAITTGASDDLKRVADIAHAMVFEYAMGTGTASLRVVGNDASESTRRVRDEEVHELADEGFRAALHLIDSHRAQLDDIALTLLENEVLERADIDRILGDVPRAAPSRRGNGELGMAAATASKPAERPARR